MSSCLARLLGGVGVVVLAVFPSPRAEAGKGELDLSAAYRLGALREVIASGDIDVHVLSDSIGVPTDDRYTTAIGWILESVTGDLPTRVASGAGDFVTKRRFGMGLAFQTTPDLVGLNAQQFDPYLGADGRAPLSLGGQGCEFVHDGSHSYGMMNGRYGTVASISANSTSSSGSTSGGALANVVLPGLDNRVLASLFVQAGAYGLPDREFIVQDLNRNGALLGQFNPSSDISGYRHLGEPVSVARGSAVAGRIGRLLPSFEITGQVSANETLRGVISDLERSESSTNSAVNDGTNLSFVGMALSRAENSGEWVGGTALYHHGGNSWNLDDFATDMSATMAEPKRFSDQEWLYAMDAWTLGRSTRRAGRSTSFVSQRRAARQRWTSEITRSP